MKSQRIGVVIFLLGVLFLFMHTTFPFLWAALGISSPYPLASDRGFLFYLQGFSPVIGAGLLVAGGLVYGRQEER